MRTSRGGPPPMRRHKPKPKPVETVFKIEEEYITLGQLLKMTGIVGSGGEAKLYLAETIVQINGEPEQRRGRKLRPGDLIVPPGVTPIRLATSGEPTHSVEED